MFSPLPAPKRRIGFLFLPFWQIDRWRRDATCDAPDEIRPVITWTQDGSRRLISAACARARSLGIEPGMTLAQAQAMLPELGVRRATPDADADALGKLADWCRRYTPLTRAEPPDGIWLDLSGCTHLFGGERALLLDLSDRLRRFGLSVRIAVAETAGAAFAVARFTETASTTVSVPPGALARFLSPLPVSSLRIGTQGEALLHRFGLRRIGALESLPRAPLARRLGADILLRLDQAFGRVAEPICPDLPQAELQERLGFLEPLQTADSLAAANALLCRRLCDRLRTLCLGARRLELVFVRLDGSIHSQIVTMAVPSNDARHINRLLDERLDRVDPGEGVETIWLLVRVAEPADRAQITLRTLAAEATAGVLVELAPLIDTLALRLGQNRLWPPVPVESDVPERSVERRAPLDAISPADPDEWPAFLPRPVRLLDPPQPVRALAALPDHPPVWFIWRAHRHVVRRADGPERIAGEWWRRGGELFALRDYFRVEDEAGRRFWLFRRGDGTSPNTGDLGWFLHGLF